MSSELNMKSTNRLILIAALGAAVALHAQSSSTNGKDNPGSGGNASSGANGNSKAGSNGAASLRAAAAFELPRFKANSKSGDARSVAREHTTVHELSSTEKPPPAPAPTRKSAT